MCAQLRRRIPPVRLHVLGSVPGALVLQLRQEARHSSVGNGSGEPTVPHHSRHVQRLHHHPATPSWLSPSLPCDDVVVPNVHDPGVKVAPPGVETLPPVGVIAAAMHMLRLRAMALSSRRNRFKPLAKALGLSTVVPSEHTAIVPTPTSTPIVGPSFTGGSSAPSSTQKQANQVPAVRLMVTSRMDPRNRRALHHCHHADLRQYHGLAVHPHRVGAVVRTKPLLVLPPLEPGEPHTSPGTLTSLDTLAILAPSFQPPAPKVDDRILRCILGQRPRPTAR